MESLVVAALVDDAGHKGHGVFIDYGQRARKQEQDAVERICREYAFNLEVVHLTLPFLGSHALLRDTSISYKYEAARAMGLKCPKPVKGSVAHVVPFRNFMFLGIAASFASTVAAQEVWTGFDFVSGGGATWDQSPGFTDKVNETFGAAHERPRLITPLQGKTKTGTARLGETLSVDWGLSWSCYNDFRRACGICGNCHARKNAFIEAGAFDPTRYCTADFLRNEWPN
jgi:7-cyano-7-deazaguanine synthase